MPVAFAIRGNSTKSVVLAAVNATVSSTVPLIPLATTFADPTSPPVTVPVATDTGAVVASPPTDAPAAVTEPTVAATSVALAPAAPATQPQPATNPPTTQPLVVAPAAASASPEVAVVEVKATPIVTAPPTTAATPATPAVPVSTAAPVTTAAQPVAVDISKCAKTYAVVAGDYWIRIAKKISVSLSDLLAVNNADTNTALFPGRIICAPANASPPTTSVPAQPPANTQPPAMTAAKPPTTTAPPVTTSPPATTIKPPSTTVSAPPRNTYSTATIEQIIREVWPDDQEDEAISIAWRESNHNPTVHNYCCYGLFQIYYSVHKTWLNAMGITSADMLYDPRVNATAAYALYQRSGGWGPWAL